MAVSYWIVFVIFYGILKGSREPMKKAVLSSVNVPTALFAYTFIGFLMAAFTVKGNLALSGYTFFLVAAKSFAVFVAWTASFAALKKVPVSVYGITDMSRVIFATIMSLLFLHESLTVKGIVSLILVAGGLYFANKRQSDGEEQFSMKYTWLIIFSCFMNAVSGILDKYIMSLGVITSSVLQFYFMLMLSVMYIAYIVIKKEKFQLVTALKNPWLYALSLSLVFGDRLLFAANSDPESLVSVMTVVKQSSAIVTIILGKLIYNEKNIRRKLICAGVILAGIALAAF